MKFFRFLLNSGLFILVFFGVQLISIIGYNAVAIQTSDSKVIIPVVQLSQTDRVSQFDAYEFIAVDLATNYVKDDSVKFRIRSLINAEWWIKGMKWADYALDGVIALAKPVLVPVAQVDNLKEYRDIEGRDFIENLELIYSKSYPTNADVKLKEDLIRLGEVRYDDLVKYNLLTDVEVYVGEVIIKQEVVTELEFAKFADKSPKVYNEFWKVQKYNHKFYDNIHLRLIEDDTVRVETLVLFTIQYVSLISAIIFVRLYPVTLIQARITGRKRKNKEDLVI